MTIECGLVLLTRVFNVFTLTKCYTCNTIHHKKSLYFFVVEKNYVHKNVKCSRFKCPYCKGLVISLPTFFLFSQFLLILQHILSTLIYTNCGVNYIKQQTNKRTIAKTFMKFSSMNREGVSGVPGAFSQPNSRRRKFCELQAVSLSVSPLYCEREEYTTSTRKIWI